MSWTKGDMHPTVTTSDLRIEAGDLIDECTPPEFNGLVPVTLFLLLSVLSTEALIVGPQFDTRRVDGVLAPRFFGFGAHPVLVTDVDDDLPPRGRLYLGGNADLYVLVDPCNDDAVEMVSVGSSRIDIIDEVSC